MGRRAKVSSGNKPEKDLEEAWKKIFKGLVDMIHEQQRQLESLAKDRKFLEKRIQLQHDKWVSSVKFFEDEIYQMKRDFKTKEMLHLVEAAKANLIVGMKLKEATMYKLKLGDVEDERADLKVLFDELSLCLTEPKRVTRSNSKDSDLSALKAERDFVWNQYKKMESKLQEQVKRIKSEAQDANDKVQILISDLEQIQSSNIEKDRIIVSLKDDMAMLASDSRKKSEEISRLSKELELLRKSRSDSTPVLRRCTRQSGPSGLGGTNNHLNGLVITAKKDLHPSHIVEKELRSSKRKAVETDSTLESPRLFTSKFKVPKVKISSPSCS